MDPGASLELAALALASGAVGVPVVISETASWQNHSVGSVVDFAAVASYRGLSLER